MTSETWRYLGIWVLLLSLVGRVVPIYLTDEQTEIQKD